MNDKQNILISEALNSIKGKCHLKDRYIAENLGLSCSELNCVKQYLTTDHISVKDLAEKLNITSGGVTRIVAQLEEKEILRRDMDPGDRRGIIVSLTKKGNDITKNLGKVTYEYYEKIFNGLGPEDKGKIIEGLMILNEIWNKNSSVLGADIRNSGNFNC